MVLDGFWWFFSVSGVVQVVVQARHAPLANFRSLSVPPVQQFAHPSHIHLMHHKSNTHKIMGKGLLFHMCLQVVTAVSKLTERMAT